MSSAYRLYSLELQEGTEIHYHSTFTRAPLAVPITFTPASQRGARACSSSGL